MDLVSNMLFFKKNRKHSDDHQKDVDDRTSLFTHNLNDSILTSQSNLLLQDFKDSLEHSKITMLPNFDINPTGREFGNFLCIDLGGSTLRIAVVEIKGERKESLDLDILKADIVQHEEHVEAQEAQGSPISEETYSLLLKIPTNNSSESKLNLTNLDTTDSSIHSEYDKSVPDSRVNVLVEKKWTIANDKKTIDLDFFKFIAEKILEILSSQTLIDRTSIVSTGITWSFPLKSTSHNSGRIVHVSKGYTISDEIYNKELKDVLEGVCKKEFDIDIDVKCVINDLLAVYSAGLFFDRHTKLALVLGTGFNVCCSLNGGEYLAETPGHLSILKEKILPGSSSSHLINTELSLFGDNMLPYLTNKFDYIIEPRFQDFQFDFRCFMSTDTNGALMQPTEMMTSGRYLPELTRLVLVDLINDNHIFNSIDKSSLHKILNVPYDGFDGELMCLIDESNNIPRIIERFASTYCIDKTLLKESDIVTMKEIIAAILQRGAFIVAITIVSFLKLLKQQNKLDEKLVVISYVGSVLTYFHNYRVEVKKFINANSFVKDAGITVDFKLVDNSSIIGAAIGAAYFG